MLWERPQCVRVRREDTGRECYSNRDALLDDYTPKELVGRDAELQQYHSALQPAIYGEQPNNIFLYGKAGVGKTAATRFLLNKLQGDAEQYDDLQVNSQLVNCDGTDSSYQVAVELVNRLRDIEDQISESGYSRSQVYRLMWNEFDDLQGIVLIVLDEVDHLEDDSILYQLSRARENQHLEKSRVAVIGISNDLSYRKRLSPKVRSSLCERSISFSTYNAQELQQVLSQRRDVAFKEDTVDDAVVGLCSAYGARESGDARKALDLLLKAGDVARDENAEEVLERHVHEGRKLLEREEVAQGIANLNEQERLMVYAVATYAAEGSTPVRSTDLYERYESLARSSGRDPLSSRWMREHLDELAMLGIISVEKRNEGAMGGMYRVHELEQDLKVVVDALKETIDNAGLHASVRQVAESD
ncbi:orc1/cdc6 family replication initiation protein [Halobium palmae]|uniref:ORC1-type DNA replication protein n=1 Tax=Halobium palmae TaxID=1776492 RepID=A0ABD5RWG8_9EURY